MKSMYLALAPQIDSKASLMLTAAGESHIVLSKLEAMFLERVVPNGLLLLLTAPAGDGDNFPTAPDGVDTRLQQLRSPPL